LIRIMAATTPQKTNGDHTATTFSYAQAAKGRSPSVPETTLDAEKPSPKRTASEGHMPSGIDSKTQSESEIASPEKPETNKSSVPSSPEFGTASTSTLPKEDDPFSPRNGSSDSTWDKQSENSQNGGKGAEKAEAEKHKDDPLSWSDDVPAAPALKEAPPPIVNFWQQRREAQEAKVRASKQLVSPSAKAIDAGIGSTNAPRHAGEIKKQDTQRKSKGYSGNLDANAASGHTRDGNKTADSRTRNGDDGMSINL